MLERVSDSVADSLVKTRSMTNAWPLQSSLVGTLGSFMSLNEDPCSHSSVSLVCRFGVGAPSSQLGSLMFQSPTMTIREGQCGMWVCRQSDVHSQVSP